MTEIALDGVLVDVGNKNDKYEKFPPTKLAWDIKGAGVASTVVQKQTDKFQVCSLIVVLPRALEPMMGDKGYEDVSPQT